MTRAWGWLRSAWAWYLVAARHEHEYGEYGECECGKICGDW